MFLMLCYLHFPDPLRRYVSEWSYDDHCAYQRCRMTVRSDHDYWERRDWLVELGNKALDFETASRAHMIKDDGTCPKSIRETLCH